VGFWRRWYWEKKIRGRDACDKAQTINEMVKNHDETVNDGFR
jgi:hypothetical protein